MNLIRAYSFLLVILFIVSGCASPQERKDRDLRRQYSQYDRYIPARLKDASFSDISVVHAVSKHNIISSIEEYRNISGPFILESPFLRYTNGNYSSGTSWWHIAYLDPGKYLLTAWIGIINHWECELTDGSWAVCDGPKTYYEWTERTYTGLPGHRPTEKKWVERNVARSIKDYSRIKCEVTLKPGVKYHSGLIIAGCRDAQDPEKNILSPKDREWLGMKFIGIEYATKEEAFNALKAESSIEVLGFQE